MKETYTISNETLAHIIKVFQFAIMTGTDISDLLRLVRLQKSENDASVIELTPEYEQVFAKSLQQMQEKAERLIEEYTNSNIEA